MLIGDAGRPQRLERPRIAVDQRGRACHQVTGRVLGDAQRGGELEAQRAVDHLVCAGPGSSGRHRVPPCGSHARVLLGRVHRDEGGDVGDLIDRIAGEERLLERGDIRPVAGVRLRLDVTVHT